MSAVLPGHRDRYLRGRGQLGRRATCVKLADALHLAAAIEFGCDEFLTNDNQLANFPDITVEELP